MQLHVRAVGPKSADHAPLGPKPPSCPYAPRPASAAPCAGHTMHSKTCHRRPEAVSTPSAGRLEDAPPAHPTPASLARSHATAPLREHSTLPSRAVSTAQRPRTGFAPARAVGAALTRAAIAAPARAAGAVHHMGTGIGQPYPSPLRTGPVTPSNRSSMGRKRQGPAGKKFQKKKGKNGEGKK